MASSAEPERWSIGQVRAAALACVGLALLAAGGVWAKTATEVAPPEAGAGRPRMIIVPAGTFTMGSPAQEPGHEDDEPEHPVSIPRAFEIAETEVTQAQWLAVMGANPSWFDASRGGGPQHPVERVSWFDALEYLNRLSAREGLTPCYALDGCTGAVRGGGCGEEEMSCIGDFTCTKVAVEPECLEPGPASKHGYRLPTEEEWEYAARAGTRTAVYAGPADDRTLMGIAWFGENAADRTYPVAQLAPNAWHLRDAIGNVWEWTASVYGEAGPAEGKEPQVAQGGSAVVRGCGFVNAARYCRAAARGVDGPAYRRAVFGFRPARSSSLDP